MSFNQTTGVYTPAAGALTAAPGQVVQSAVWDAIFTDMTSSFTAAMQALQSTYGQRNIIGANGGMEVWQRGGITGSIGVNASNTAYTADRWYLAAGANEAMSVNRVAGITTGSEFACKVARNSGQTGTTALTFGFPLDSDECSMIAGQIVALSFVAKAGANWSPTSGTLTATLNAGTGAPVKFSTGSYAGASTPINAVGSNLTTSATRYTMVSSAVATTTAQAEVTFTWTPVGTAGADDSFTIDDIQLEILPSATSPIAQFERWPFERMLAACKRHYRKTFPYATAPAQAAGIPGAATIVEQAATAAGFWWQFSGGISLRATGAITSFNPSGASANAQNITQASSLAVSLDAAGMNSSEGIMIYVSASGATITAAAKDIVILHLQADAGI